MAILRLWWGKTQVFSPRKLGFFGLTTVPVGLSSSCKHRQCLLEITLSYWLEHLLILTRNWWSKQCKNYGVNLRLFIPSWSQNNLREIIWNRSPRRIKSDELSWTKLNCWLEARPVQKDNQSYTSHAPENRFFGTGKFRTIPGGHACLHNPMIYLEHICIVSWGPIF